MNWIDYLPPTLQVAAVYWVMGSCVGIRMICATIPEKYRTPWLMQLIVLTVAVPVAILMFPETVAKVYAVATGIMSAALSVQFYDLVFTSLEKKIRGWVGSSNPPSEPLQYPPVSPTQPPTER